MISEDRRKALTTAMTQIEKNFGKGSIMMLGAETRLDVHTISTGSLSLDVALGVGGVAKGRITEIYGLESGGKTTLALSIVAQCQKAGGTAAFIDAEHALDPVYARALGVNTDDLLVSQPDNGEQALEIMELLVRSGAVDIIVVDSVAALVPRAEIEGDMGGSLPGLQARLMSQALRKLAGVLNKTNTAAIFINQIREKIGISYGSPEVTTGGKALKFYATMRLDVRKSGPVNKVGTETVSHTVKIKVIKNKVAPPFKEVELTIGYGTGFDQVSDLVGLATDYEIIQKSGSFYSYGDERIGQGKEKAVAFIAERPAVQQEIRDRVMSVIKSGKEFIAVLQVPDTDAVSDTDAVPSTDAATAELV